MVRKYLHFRGIDVVQRTSSIIQTTSRVNKATSLLDPSFRPGEEESARHSFTESAELFEKVNSPVSPQKGRGQCLNSGNAEARCCQTCLAILVYLQATGKIEILLRGVRLSIVNLRIEYFSDSENT